MPDTKITALAAITTVAPANDLFAIVDVSDNSMAASGTTKNITTNQILGAGGTATLASATITGDLTVRTSGLSVSSSGVGIGSATPTSGTLSLVSRFLLFGDSQAKLGDSGLVNGAAADGNTQLQYFGGKSLFFNEGVANRMTLNSTGLGVGRSPAYKLDVSSATASNQLRLSGSNQNSMVFANAAAGASNGFLMGRSFSSDDANNFFVFDLATSALRLFIGNTGNVGIGTAAPTEAVDLNSGNLKLTNGNVVIGTSGKGIDFSATTSGSGTMTSELLADYEEGTFTPTIGGSASNGTATYSTQTGVYTKIGRIVQIQIFVAWSAGTATGNQTVRGLPFAAHATSTNFSILNTYPIDIALTAGYSATSSIPPNGSIINLYQIPTGGGSDLSVPCDAAGTLIFTGTYTVA